MFHETSKKVFGTKFSFLCKQRLSPRKLGYDFLEKKENKFESFLKFDNIKIFGFAFEVKTKIYVEKEKNIFEKINHEEKKEKLF